MSTNPPSGTCWIGEWGLGPFPPEMSGNLQVPWWKSGVTSHSKNWQIWCRPWDALQYLMQLVATPDTDCYFWFWPPFVQGHIIQFLLVQCLRNLFSLCLSCWILFCSYKYLHVKFAENKHSWQWEDVSFLAEFSTSVGCCLSHHTSQTFTKLYISLHSTVRALQPNLPP